MVRPECIVPVYGHAVHSAAMAYLMAKSLGLDTAELDKILDFTHVCSGRLYPCFRFGLKIYLWFMVSIPNFGVGIKMSELTCPCSTSWGRAEKFLITPSKVAPIFFRVGNGKWYETLLPLVTGRV